MSLIGSRRDLVAALVARVAPVPVHYIAAPVQAAAPFYVIRPGNSYAAVDAFGAGVYMTLEVGVYVPWAVAADALDAVDQAVDRAGDLVRSVSGPRIVSWNGADVLAGEFTVGAAANIGIDVLAGPPPFPAGYSWWSAYPPAGYPGELVAGWRARGVGASDLLPGDPAADATSPPAIRPGYGLEVDVDAAGVAGGVPVVDPAAQFLRCVLPAAIPSSWSFGIVFDPSAYAAIVTGPTLILTRPANGVRNGIRSYPAEGVFRAGTNLDAPALPIGSGPWQSLVIETDSSVDPDVGVMHDVGADTSAVSGPTYTAGTLPTVHDVTGSFSDPTNSGTPTRLQIVFAGPGQITSTPEWPALRDWLELVTTTA